MQTTFHPSFPIARVLIAALLLCVDGEAQSKSLRWRPLDIGTSDAVYAMHFLGDRIGHAVAWSGGSGAYVSSTTDGGRTWTAVLPRPRTQLFDIQFIDRTTGFAVGHDIGMGTSLVLRTQDGGESWTPTFLSSFGLYQVEFPTPTTGYACGFGGLAFKTEDGGDTWVRLPLVAPGGLILRSMAFHDSRVGVVLALPTVSLPARLYGTEDGGATWDLVHRWSVGEFLVSMTFVDERTGYAAGGDTNGGLVQRTEDGGMTWSTVSSGPGGGLQHVHATRGEVWAVGNASSVLRSRDAGRSWDVSPAPAGAGELLFVHRSSDGVFLTGNSLYGAKGVDRVERAVPASRPMRFVIPLLPSEVTRFGLRFREAYAALGAGLDD